MPGWNKTVRAFLSRATLRDILMLVNMILMVMVGSALLLRTFFSHHGSFLSYAMGGGLILAGLYRGHLIYQVLTWMRLSSVDTQNQILKRA